MADAVQNLSPTPASMDPGLRLSDGKSLANAINDGSGRSSQDEMTASTTQTQAGGLASCKLTASFSRITTANANDAATIGFNAVPGREFTIINDSGQTIRLFPFTGDLINDAAVNAQVDIANNTISRYVCPARGKWFGGATTFET